MIHIPTGVARQSRNQNPSRELRERREPANCSGALWSCDKIGIGRFPSLHHRKDGSPSDQKIIAKPPLTARPGGFPMKTNGKPPRLRQLRWLREIFLMTQPPLLAVVQGGDYRLIPIYSLLLWP